MAERLDYGEMTMREARALFFKTYSAPSDGGYSANTWAFYKIGNFQPRVKNFKWRQQAIAHHDLHHILTGYKCNPAGEMQMAAWEYSAGRFPHICATLFCLPLVSMGAILFPKRTFEAFFRGRSSKTLYSMPITDDLLDAKVNHVRAEVLPDTDIKPVVADYMAYLKLVAQSLAIILCPAILLISAIYIAHDKF
jgi:hypothetical protein